MGFLDMTDSADDMSMFREHAAKWREARAVMSSPSDMAALSDYLRIIGMGERAIPLMLEDLRKRADHWFIALHAITGVSPVPAEDRGRLDKMAEAWIAWGEQNGYL